MSDPDLDVLGVINTAVGALTTGTNLFRGKMRATGTGIPSKAVFVLSSGGERSQDFLTGGSHTPQLKKPSVQIMVRSGEREFLTGQTLARSVYDAVHDSPPTGYISSRVTASEPFYISEDDEGNHLWSINIDLMINE